MRLSEEDKKWIKILYRNSLNVKEIEKLLNNNFSKNAIQKHIYRHLKEFRKEHTINSALNKDKLKKDFKNIIKNNFKWMIFHNFQEYYLYILKLGGIRVWKQLKK